METAYKKAGVDVHAGYEAVNLIKKHIDKTKIKGTMDSLGAFGAAFDLSSHMVENPVLVSGTDGVGTKLLIAQELDIHDTIGIDAVAMCVNDVVAMGAKPLFFLDYIATGKVVPEKIEQIVKGIAEGCVLAGCSLIGGETAEMPDMYGENEYDIAGYTTGIVDKNKIITGEIIKKGDVLVGLPSSGLHSNGFSLVRKFLKASEDLLTPTKIYVKEVLEILETTEVKGIAHITGGGFYENIPRILPVGLVAKIKLGSWPILPIFDLVQKEALITQSEMFGIFNMGIGMVLVVSKEEVSKIKNGFVIGEVIERKVKGEGVIIQ